MRKSVVIHGCMVAIRYSERMLHGARRDGGMGVYRREGLVWRQMFVFCSAQSEAGALAVDRDQWLGGARE